MKFVAKAAMLVGSVAAVASGVGAIAGSAAFLSATGVSLGTAQAVAAAASAVSAVSTSLSQKKPSAQGSLTSFTLDPKAGIPYMVGRVGFAGNINHRDTWGTDNQYQGFSVVWSGAGPIEAIEKFQVDYTDVTFAGGAAQGNFKDWMWLNTQLGQAPEPNALASPVAGFPGVDANYRLSGMFAGIWVLKFDKKGKKFSGGVPAPLMVARGVKVYDPRLDSTYPGGSGPCRAFDESTYVGSQNAPLHALTYAMGRFQNGQRVMGVGMAIDQIEVDQYVDAANVFDANNWKMGGVIYSTDEKWDALKKFMQLSGGEPMQLSAKLSCWFQSPKVSIANIYESDLKGAASVVGTQTRRDRINTCIPRYQSEPHGWQTIPATEVTVPEYVTMDRGRKRTEELEVALGVDLKHVTQLAAYRIAQSREIGPIQFVLGPEWIGLRPADCITVFFPSIGLNGKKVVIRSRQLDPATGAVTFTAITETDSKHPFALGQVGSAPPAPDLTVGEPTDGSLEDPNLDLLRRILISNSHVVLAAGTSISAVGADAATPLATFSGDTYAAPGVPALANGQNYSVLLRDDSTVANGNITYMDAGGYRFRIINGGGVTIPPSQLKAGVFVNFQLSTAGAGHLFLGSRMSTTTIQVPAHTRRYDDADKAVNAGNINGLAFGTTYYIYYDDQSRAGGAVAYAATTDANAAYNQQAYPYRHYVGTVTTPAVGAAGTTGTSA